MELKINANRKAIIDALTGVETPMTLAEISAVVGFTVKSGTTNTMVKAGVLVKVGERTIVCPCCGHKHKVAEYTLGNVGLNA